MKVKLQKNGITEQSSPVSLRSCTHRFEHEEDISSAAIMASRAIPDSQVPSDNEDMQSDEDGLWPRSAIREFLQEYKIMKIDHLQGDNLSERHWLQLCTKLNSGSRVYTAKQLKNKRDLLRKIFKKEQAKKGRTGEGASNWEWYDAMYEIMHSTPSLNGIPNASDNGECHNIPTGGERNSTDSPPMMDLNHTPPGSDPRVQNPSVPNGSTVGRRSRTIERLVNRNDPDDVETGEPSVIATPGIQGQAVRKGGRSPVSKSIKLVANAMNTFTEAFVESKKRKSDSDDRRTKLLEDLFALKRREMFPDDP
ncbi:hypothetical protein R1sor_004574 [Riccia sorocarpa]|uniref:Uncharacterized protein n=1 Tax=Riccia sorocarpa TaxID=122646 RepID=A0ABD3HHM8_9MARC